MAHNISTSNEYRPIRLPDSHNRPFAPDCDFPVLTVSDSGTHGRGRDVSIMFRHSERMGYALVVDPWIDPVDIAGEDLYALRELLNEMPEEAFVRPADPVDPVAEAVAAFDAAPPMSIAVEQDGTAWQKTYHGRWVESGIDNAETSATIVRYGARIVWTPGQ